MKKEKTWTYHTSHSFMHLQDGITYHFTTQLYFVGVYGILTGNPGQYDQGSYEPKDLVSLERKLIKMQKKGEITNLTFGREITVKETEKKGFEEV